MRRIGFIWIVGIFLLLFVVPVSAQEIPDFITDSLTMDSIAIDSLDPDPEWYVEPLVREADFAPRRAAAANCPVDSVLTFNVDSVLVEVTMYEYGDTTRTMVWTVNADGSRIGKSRTESASTATTSYSATYAWDANTNNWKGTSKEEHIYAGTKETERILYNTWLNNDWVADTKYTWAYDAAGRDTEFTTFTRNTSTNELEYSNCRISNYNSIGSLILEIQYTAYTNGAWSEGTKRVWDYNSIGYQTLTEYYSSYSNGSWIGSSKETWGYNTSNKKILNEKYSWSNNDWYCHTRETWEYNGPSSKQTLHEKYTLSNNVMSLSLQENLGYDASGNNTLIENYSITNNVRKGTKKIEYIYSGSTRIGTINYTWKNDEFVKSTWSVTQTTTNPTDQCTYNWKNDTWVGTGTRVMEYKTNGKVTERTTQNWPTNATDWVNKTCTTTVYSGANKTQEAYYTWSNDAWVGTKRTDYHYNAKNQNDTTKTYTNDGTNWIYSNRTVNTFNASGVNIMTHNAKWENSMWVMTSMTRKETSDVTIDGIRQTLNASWRCGSDSVWIGVQKDTTSYNASGKPIYIASFTSWANNDWVPSYRVEYTYNDAGQTVLQQRFDYSGNAWLGHYRYEYAYDDARRQSMSAIYNNWNSALKIWVGSSKTETTFNSQGQKSIVINYSWQNNAWMASAKSIFGYDANNNVIEQVVQNYSNNTWVNSIRYESLYRGSLKIKSNEYSWRNNEWQISRKSEKYYDEDAQAKLRREIEGRWSNGNVTSYADKSYSYNCDPRFFTIRFVNYDGEELASYSIEEGQTPSYHGTEPTKQENAEFTYSFDGWTPSVVPVTGNATYTATYNAAKRTYTITWLNEDGSQLGQETLEYGATPAHADINKESTAEFTYTFAGWTPGIGIVTGDASYTATFSATKNSYYIIWLNDDNTEIDRTLVEYGVVPTHTVPTKEATDEHSYFFDKWTPDVVAVTGEATYKATYTETTKVYTITWLNEDGTEISYESLEYGATPSHTAPTKDATAEYTYTFAGWNPAVTSVTGDASYTATYTATKRSYTITWLNEDGTEISHETMEYGATPSHADIYKESTAEFTYTFAGWTPGIGIVTGDASYTASFTATKNKYTIIFLNYDGSELQSSEVEYGIIPNYEGATPIKPADAQDTYTFAGWDQEIIPVAGTKTYTATFTGTKNSYTITWLNEDGSEIEHETLEYGATPQHEAATKENTAEWTYAFTGWSPAIVSVTGDATYQATFTQTKNSYTITWLNEDGIEIEHETLEYGVTPAHADMTKENTAEYTYTFTGWTPAIVSITGDASYTATFSATKNKYTITWLNDDNTQIDQTTVEYGETPTHVDPTKEATAEFNYTFAGWTPTITTVTGDVTYTATFTSTVRSYTITWKNEDGSVIESETLEYGATPAHADITKESTAEYTYTFAGWTPGIGIVTSDAEYTATFTQTKNSYLITFQNEDGTVLSSDTYEYGTMPTIPTAPTKPADGANTYTFAGWDKEIVAVTEAATYTATYTTTKNSYTITWKNEDGNIIESETLEYGATPAHADINKESTAEYTYTFAGWTPQITAATCDAVYTATFTATKNKYLITFKNEDGTTLKSEELEYGVMPTAPANQTKAATAEWTYTFAGWDKEIISVAEATTYTATYTATKNSYTITWLNDDLSQIDQTTVEYGVVPTHADPTKASTAEYTYNFIGWDEEIVAVTGEATYKATYSSTKNSYTITWLDEDNSALGSTTLEYGIVPTHEDPTKQPTAQYGYTFAGWSPAITSVTGNATYKATYTDTINQYTISWLDDTGTLVDQTKVAYGTTPAHANIYKESDDQFDYTFVGWTPTLVPVTGEASYSAIFTTAGKSYTVTFYFEDGVTVLDQMTLPYGAIPSTPYIPSIPSDANHTYTFSGWSPEIAPVTGDISYVPTFTAIPNQYTVIFRNYNGKELQRKKVDYGTIPEYEGDEPSRPATNSYTWAFEGWTPELVAVVGDATYTAVYTKVMNTYTILFYDEDGSTLLDEVTVEHGQKPTTSVIPTKEADEEYRYTFAGWSPKIAKATADAEYKATYTATPKTQGLNNTEAEGAAIKVIIEDKIFIRRGGNTYSIDGQRVK